MKFFTFHFSFFTFLLIGTLTGCKAKAIFLPVEILKTEYHDKEVRDSIYLHDSILIKHKGDTVFFEKYKYLYRDKLVRDSVFIKDSIAVPYPVVEYKEVNRLTGFQSFQMWCGRILVLILLGWIGIRWIKK